MNLAELERLLSPAALASVKAQLGEMAPVPRASKYRNQPTYADGIRFDSKREANYYLGLKAAHGAGEVRWFCRQPRFAIESGDYVADFVVVWKDGRVEVVDAKGIRTKEYKGKRRSMKARYGIEIREV